MADGSATEKPCRCIAPERCLRRYVCRLGDLPGTTVTVRRLARGTRLPPMPAGRMRFHVMKSGLSAAAAVMPDGRRQLLCFHVPGDIVCPLGAGNLACWVEALGPVETWEIDLPGTASALRADPLLAGFFFEMAHHDLARALSHVVMLGRLDGTERLAAFLVDMTRRTGRRRGETWHLSLPMSREDMADYLGLNAETVSRILSRIKKAGLARFRSPTECEIPDLDRLIAQAPLDTPAYPLSGPRGGPSSTLARQEISA